MAGRRIFNEQDARRCLARLLCLKGAVTRTRAHAGQAQTSAGADIADDVIVFHEPVHDERSAFGPRRRPAR